MASQQTKYIQKNNTYVQPVVIPVHTFCVVYLYCLKHRLVCVTPKQYQHAYLQQCANVYFLIFFFTFFTSVSARGRTCPATQYKQCKVGSRMRIIAGGKQHRTRPAGGAELAGDPAVLHQAPSAAVQPCYPNPWQHPRVGPPLGWTAAAVPEGPSAADAACQAPASVMWQQGGRSSTKNGAS